MISNYYQYYVVDILKPPFYLFSKFYIADGESATALFQASILIGSTFSAIPVGYLSDKYGRRFLLFLSFLFQLSAPIGFSISVLSKFSNTSFALDLVYGFFYGIGNASFNTIAFVFI